MVTKKSKERRTYLPEHLKAQGLSDEAFAEIMGVQRPTVNRWKNVKRDLNTRKVEAIEKALGLKKGELYHPPGQDSLDAIVADASPEVRLKIAEAVRLLLKSVQ